MWKPKQVQDDDDSWEVRAFGEDTGSILGATWPPRSYTCTFCRREFRSAQALGGHMNVHRRDRARLHQAQSPATSATSSPSSSHSAFIFPNQDFPGNAGVCLLYQIPNPNSVFSTPTNRNTSDTLFSISPYLGRNKNNLIGQPVNFSVTPSPGSTPLHFYPSNVDIKADIVATIDKSKTTLVNSPNNSKRKDLANEEPELDLELRLGHRSRKATLWPDRR